MLAPEERMTGLTAEQIMARSEATLDPDMDIYVAMKRLLASKLTGAPVVDDRGALLGMLTERDCLKVLVGGALDGLPAGTVRDYMTSPAKSITPSTSLYDIVHVFLTRSFRKLPVVDDTGTVVGQVSRRDALVALESLTDNPRLYGTGDAAPDGGGVDTAMRIARGKR